jgi:hypothetical protein
LVTITNFKTFFHYLYIMKIEISEKQFKGILRNIKENQELTEQGETTSDATTSGGAGYPQVGKWDSGVTRGPGNQIGLTKWSDIVGSVLKRGKANPLK